MVTYGSIISVKNILGQSGTGNDVKIQEYQLLAYNFINSSVTNIEPVIPIPTPDAYILEFENSLAAAYFYKYESGDDVLATALEEMFESIYKRNKYNRPQFFTRYGT